MLSFENSLRHVLIVVFALAKEGFLHVEIIIV